MVLLLSIGKIFLLVVLFFGYVEIDLTCDKWAIPREQDTKHNEVKDRDESVREASSKGHIIQETHRPRQNVRGHIVTDYHYTIQRLGEK
jgi:hypothetical protein